MSTRKWAVTARIVRNTGIIALFFLVGACVTVGEIQKTAPIQTMNFKGSTKSVAQCIQRRLNARVQYDGFGDKFIVYNSVKTLADRGMTHYAITVAKTGPNEGVVEWRVMRSDTDLDPAMEQRFWTPAKECAEQAKPEK